MEHIEFERRTAFRSPWVYRMCVALLSASLALAACSPQPTSSNAPGAATASQLQVTHDPVLAASEIQPTLTPSITSSGTQAAGNLVSPAPSQGNQADSPGARSYHALLMLERAADLMLALIEKIQAGEISQGDSSAIAPYANAFPVAIEAFNQATPPGELADAWTQVYMAAQQYNQAYTLLVWGQPISSKNLDSLKETREILSIDQETVEVYLAQGGLGPDFYSAQQQAVDEHLQQL